MHVPVILAAQNHKVSLYFAHATHGAQFENHVRSGGRVLEDLCCLYWHIIILSGCGVVAQDSPHAKATEVNYSAVSDCTRPSSFSAFALRRASSARTSSTSWMRWYRLSMSWLHCTILEDALLASLTSAASSALISASIALNIGQYLKNLGLEDNGELGVEALAGLYLVAYAVAVVHGNDSTHFLAAGLATSEGVAHHGALTHVLEVLSDGQLGPCCGDAVVQGSHTISSLVEGGEVPVDAVVQLGDSVGHGESSNKIEV